MIVEEQIQELAALLNELKKAQTPQEKRDYLSRTALVALALQSGGYAFSRSAFPPELRIAAEIAFYSILAIGQGEIVFHKRRVDANLLSTLIAVDHFYESIGGLIGYHLTVLEKIHEKRQKRAPQSFTRISGLDLAKESVQKSRALFSGILALPHLAEIYPMGGLGTRLGLKSLSGESLPVAHLPFLGSTLLEGLVRDLQAREYVYYKLFGKQLVTPIAMMTSLEANNHAQIEQLCRSREWFGRPEESYCLFSQLSVPVITVEGNWSLHAPHELTMQPGGHGALWRMAEEKGVFRWLAHQRRDLLIVRQINNPIAGIDGGLIALVGVGFLEEKALGIASCERLPHAAEGMLVCIEHAHERITLSNIEYTDLESYGIEDKASETGYSEFPANTNILFVDLKKLLPVIQANPLPGLVLNMKSQVPFQDKTGKVHMVRGGRLESMMQNITDALVDRRGAQRAFVTYNERGKTLSTTKKRHEKGASLNETPEGAFYDLMKASHELLTRYCSMSILPFSTPEEYVQEGPSLIFTYHPALGPLYEVIAQKIRGGQIAKSSDLHFEIAEIDIENLDLCGSLSIEAENVLGHYERGILRYSDRIGRCTLRDVKVINAGIDREAENTFWKLSVHRKEALRIVLRGRSEFHAEGVTFEGAATLVVPDGERWVAYTREGQMVIDKQQIDAPTWSWHYQWTGERLLLSCHKPSLQGRGSLK